MDTERGRFTLTVDLPEVGKGWTVEHSWPVALLLRLAADRMEGHPHFGIGHGQPISLSYDGRPYHGQIDITDAAA